MLQLETTGSSLNNNSSNERGINRLRCKPINNVPRTTQSLSTVQSDARSFSVPQPCRGSCPTFSGSRPTASAVSRSTTSTGDASRHEALAKKMKVEVDLTEDDDFENDLDTEMLLLAQTMESKDNVTHCSRRSVDTAGQLQATAVMSSDLNARNSCRDSWSVGNGRGHTRLDTGSSTTSDPGSINYATRSCNIAGSWQSSFTDGHAVNSRDMKHCTPDMSIRDVKDYVVSRNNSVDDVHVPYSSGSAKAVAMRCTSAGSVSFVFCLFLFVHACSSTVF